MKQKRACVNPSLIRINSILKIPKGPRAPSQSLGITFHTNHHQHHHHPHVPELLFMYFVMVAQRGRSSSSSRFIPSRPCLRRHRPLWANSFAKPPPPLCLPLDHQSFTVSLCENRPSSTCLVHRAAIIGGIKSKHRPSRIWRRASSSSVCVVLF